MRARLGVLAACFPLALAAQEAPLSAIDWLSTATPVPVTRVTPPKTRKPLNETPVAKTAVQPGITVTTLDSVKPDAVGLLPASVTGLPRNLWQSSASSDLAALLAARRVERLPAMQSLLYTLLLAEADAPADSGRASLLLLARIDALMKLGAVEPAQALLERAGADTPALFQRWFDATLLTGDEDTACDALRAKPHLSASYVARVFCTARGGDWSAAALLLDTARALNFINDTEDSLLAHFLDPEMMEGEPLPLPPVRPSPILFRLYETVGEPLPTATLPRAFAMSDLRKTAGWKSSLSAAERLSRTGALSVNRLLGVYSERLPAASGGIWDRVEAIQRFDTAMKSGDPGAVSAALGRAWTAMAAARLQVPFAELYGADLIRLPLAGDAGRLAYEIALLGPGYEDAARTKGADYPTLGFETGLARGLVQNAQNGPLQNAIAAGFADTATPPQDLADLLEQGQLGAAILGAMALYEQAANGDLNALPGALTTLRAVGLEDSARRAALQLSLLKLRR